MKNKVFSGLIKCIAIALSLVIVLGSVPVSGNIAFAAEGEGISIQYLIDDVVQKNVPIKIKPDDQSDVTFEGVTDEKGIWKTEAEWSTLSEEFYVYINEDPKMIIKGEEEKSFLIINEDVKTWADSALGIVSVIIKASESSVVRSTPIHLSCDEIKGTPETYQWYHNSEKIEGATSSEYTVDSAEFADRGAYTCKVTDANGDSRTSNEVTITVTEKEASDVSLKATVNGAEVTAPISRDTTKAVKLEVIGLPTDAEATEIKYYINDECVSSGTTDKEYILNIKDNTEEYVCEAEVTFDKYYEQTKVELAAPIQAPMLSQNPVDMKAEGVEYDSEASAYVITYSASPKATFDVSVSGGSGSGAYSLEVKDEKTSDGNDASYAGKIAEISRYADENKWKVTVNNAGSFRLEASKAGDVDYNSVDPVTASFNVEKATAEGFAFANPAPEAVTYNTNNNEFTNTVVDGFSGVKYSIESGDCAEIDENTGKLTIKKAGSVTVKATLSESANYSEASATYTLTVNKAVQTIEFEENSDSIYYGQSYTRAASPVKVDDAVDGYGYNHDENVKVEYSIVTADGQEAIASVNEDGSLDFSNQKLGTVTVKATLAGNDCYEAAEAEYTLTVEAYTVENGYTVSGDKLVEDGEWYSGDITITPAENHLISKTNNLGDTNEWSDSIVISTEGAENGCDVYIKNIETGAISEAYAVASEELMLDKSVPHSLKINYKAEAWYQEVLETVTFGYYNSVVTFTLEAKDDYSGVEYFIWKFTSHDSGDIEVPETRVDAIKNGDVYESETCVLGDESNLQEFRGKISFFAYDFAGNSAESKETYIVVIDAQDPVLDITTDLTPVSVVNNAYPYYNADENSVDVIEVFADKVNVTFSIVEKNFFEENVVVTVNGEDVTENLSWAASGDNHYAELELDKDADYDIDLTYNDIFGEDINNASVKKSFSATKQICVDTQAPVVTLVLEEAAFETEDKKYYNGNAEVEIIVDEEKFRPSDIVISDVEGYNGMSVENKEFLSNPGSWTYDAENGTYSATVEFVADGDYSFSTDYSDLSGNAAEQADSGVFVIDTVNPELAISTDISPKSTVNTEYPYDNAEKDAAETVDIYSEDVTVVLTVTEKNFFPERAAVTVNGEDVSEDAEWASSGDVHTATLVFDETEDYAIDLSYTDIFGINADEKSVFEAKELIAVDKSAPEVEIVLSEENTENDGVKYYNSNVRASITVKEEKFRPSDIVISEIDGFIGVSEENKAYLLNSKNWKYDEENGLYGISIVFAAENADGNYKFAVDYTDLAGNAVQQAVSDTFTIDVTAPVITVDYGAAKLLDSDNLVIDSLDNRDFNSVTVFNDTDIVVTVTIDEVNFDPSKATVMLSKDFDDAKLYEFDGEWVSEGNVHTNTVTLSEKDVYKLYFSCIDRAQNASADYSSPKIVISDSVPSITFNVFPESDTGYRNSAPVDVTVKIFDEYFAQEKVEITVKAVDIDGKEIELGADDIIPDYKNAEWDEGENFCNSITLTLTTEGRYTVSVEYVNQMGDKSKSATDFVLDCTAPTHSIEYSQPVYSTVMRTLTFMLFNPSVDVTVTAEDNISGVDRMKVEYSNTLLPEADYGTESFEVEKTFIQESEKDEKTLEGTWTVNAEKAFVQAKGNISVTATDNANNSTAEENRTDVNNIIAIDNISSAISFSYGDAKILNSDNVVITSFEEYQKGNVTIYDNKDITVTVKVEDANFNPDTVLCSLSKDSAEAEAYKFDGEWTSDGIVYTNTVTISGEGVYKLTVTTKDLAGNESSYISAKMVISEKLPEITFEIIPDKANDYKDDHYNTGLRLNAKVFDEFFASERAEVTVTAKDSYGKEIAPEYSISDWRKGADTANIITLNFAAEGVYNVNIKYTNAVDDTAVSDRSFIIDLTAPVISMSYGEAKILDSDNVVITGFEESQKENVTVYDKKDITVTVKIKEVNFRPDAVVCAVSKNSEQSAQIPFDGKWVSEGDIHTNTVTISGEDAYKLTVACKDPACNEASYTSAKMVISTEKPEVNISIKPEKTAEYVDNYFNTTISLDIEIKDTYFSAERSDITVTVKNASGEIINVDYLISEWKKGEGTANIITYTFDKEGVYDVEVTYSNAVNDTASKKEHFVIDLTAPVISSDIEASSDPEVYDQVNYGATIIVVEENFDPEKFTVTATAEDIGNNKVNLDKLVFSEWKNVKGTFRYELTISNFVDGNYTITVTGHDKALNKADDYKTERFTVDRTAPDNIRILYSEPISSEKNGDSKDGSETKFYNDKIKVTLIADDSTAGVGYFEWVYNRQNGASNKNAEVLSGICHVDKSQETETEKTRTATAEFYLPADKIQDIRGNLTVTAIDRLYNASEPYKDKTVVVIDNTKPVIEFEYSPSDPKKSDGDFESGGTNYYDTSVTVTVIIDEANFDSNKGLILRNNDEIIKPSWTKIASGDKWKADIELSNDGSYVISAEYTDPSGNKAEDKETGVIVVDRNAPVISVTYAPETPVYTSDNREYFSQDRVATISINERNFNPADIVASVTTQNIGESTATETDLAAKLMDESAWKQDGDVYTATINYSTDGNYTFNIEYTDPAGNAAEVYEEDKFTVDKSAPENLKIRFSTNSNSEDGNTLFYDAPIKVTVTATDKISGVKSFDYSYTSSVTGDTVRKSINAVSSGADAKAEFYIPASEATQFKGTLKATATDNSGNKTATAEGKETVVYDNIAPKGDINIGNPVTNANGMSYFAGDVNATITIIESNFYPEDVTVIVDGNSVNTGNWSNNGDTWTTTVNVSSDGQHKISVSYTDKSGNVMENEESDNFVIDHTAPSIVVNGIKNKSAYNDEEIGFTITAKDDNFSSEGLKAELTVVIQNEDGGFDTKNIELERAYSSSGGYTINVANLEEDGIYTLKCSASDLCGNDANAISIDGRTENTVSFSVNRNGSIFDVDASTMSLVNDKKHTQNVEGDIVITEINVTPIDEDKVKVKVNGVELERGTQFEIKPVETEGGWYEYTYTIFADNFAEENDYSVVISSVDGSENTGYSDLKGKPIEFTVDKTAPTVSVSGIEAKGSYKTDKLTVNITPIDAGGMIQSFEVFANEKSIAVYTGEEIAEIMESSGGIITLEIGEGTYDSIRFVCTDKAGNVYDSGDEYTDIAISPNQLVLLWSKDWFKFSVIGGIALAAGLIVILVLKKKKKDEE